MRRAARVAVAAGIVAGATMVAAGPAQAFPSNCSTGYGGVHSTGYIVCYGGTGEYRARVTCDKPWAPDYKVYGSWESIYGTSIAACRDSNYAYDLYTQLIGPIG